MRAAPESAAITGFALRTPLGSAADDITEALLAGACAAQPNARFPAETYLCSLAATIPGQPRPSRHQRFVKRMGLFGIEVAEEALQRSATPVRGERLGVFCGYGGLRAHWDDLLPALQNQRDDGSADEAWARGFSQIHPFWMLSHLSNNAHALFAMAASARGDGTTTGGAAAGAEALSAAALALSVGSVDAAVVFAFDSLVEPEIVLSLGVLGAATRAGKADLAPAYDERASGVVPGEAAAAVVLERVRDAGPRALARLTAASTADGAEGFPEAATLGRVLSAVAAGDAIIDGASVALPERDQVERAAIASVLRQDAALLSLSASMGQLGSPTPLVQAIVLSRLLSRGKLPPIAGLRRPAPGPLQPVREARETSARSAIGLIAGMPGLAGAMRVELP